MARINLAVVVSLIFFGNILLAIYQRRWTLVVMSAWVAAD
jgi:hypothetical protein